MEESVVSYKSGDSEFWKGQIADWVKAETTQAGYCRQNNLNLSTFGYWKRKFTTPSPAGFIELRMKEEIPHVSDSVSPIKLLMGDNLAIEVPDRFNPDLLTSLVLVLRDLA